MSHSYAKSVSHGTDTHTHENSSEPDSDPDEIKTYEELPFEHTTDDDTDKKSDIEQNKGKLWYCQASKTWAPSFGLTKEKSSLQVVP